jgi:hypothetical protein
VLSSGRGFKLKTVLYIAAYVFPALVIWGLLAIVLRPLGSIPLLIPLLAWAYALRFGLLETLGLPFRPLGLWWQVPSSWIKGHPVMLQTLTWGTALGPGLVTKNPYAGMWLLPLLLALNHGLLAAIGIGIAVGAVHGGSRVFGVLSNRKCIDVDANAYLRILDTEARWQYMDGLALLLAAGALAAYTLSLLGAHLY